MSKRPHAILLCSCGHELQYHSDTSGHCLLQNIDESECKCKAFEAGHVIIGDGVYKLVPVPVGTPT